MKSLVKFIVLIINTASIIKELFPNCDFSNCWRHNWMHNFINLSSGLCNAIFSKFHRRLCNLTINNVNRLFQNESILTFPRCISCPCLVIMILFS